MLHSDLFLGIPKVSQTANELMKLLIIVQTRSSNGGRFVRHLDEKQSRHAEPATGTIERIWWTAISVTWQCFSDFFRLAQPINFVSRTSLRLNIKNMECTRINKIAIISQFSLTVLNKVH